MFDSASNKTTGWLGAGLLRVPAGLKVVTLSTGGLLTAVSGALGGLKLIFKYLADDLKPEELGKEIVLAKTVYVKNELAEYAYDQAFSAMVDFFYED